MALIRFSRSLQTDPGSGSNVPDHYGADSGIGIERFTYRLEEKWKSEFGQDQG